MAPRELTLELRPPSRFHVADVRALAAQMFGEALEGYSHWLCASPHTTAGYLPQNLAERLARHPQRLASYLDLFRVVFPSGAGYSHDKLELRTDLDTPTDLSTNAVRDISTALNGLLADIRTRQREP